MGEEGLYCLSWLCYKWRNVFQFWSELSPTQNPWCGVHCLHGCRRFPFLSRLNSCWLGLKHVKSFSGGSIIQIANIRDLSAFQQELSAVGLCIILKNFHCENFTYFLDRWYCPCFAIPSANCHNGCWYLTDALSCEWQHSQSAVHTVYWDCHSLVFQPFQTCWRYNKTFV